MRRELLPLCIMNKDLMNKTIGVVGSGSFGTAIVKILCEKENKVNWCVRSEEVKTFIEIENSNPKYLTSVEFRPEKIWLTSDINALVEKSDVVIFVTPSIYLLNTLKKLHLSLKDKIVVTAIKGLIPEENKIIGDFFINQYQVLEENLGVVSGPCHAEEIALERLSYLTIAFKEKEKAQMLKAKFACRYVNIILSNDIYGIEHAAILKNCYAIAAGIAHGLGYGDNFQAVLMSNAIREMEQYLNLISPIEREINASVYLGDLLVTGYSFFSRNRMLGNMIGKGYTVKSALMEMNMVPEGYYAAKGLMKIVQESELDLPILKRVYKILYENKNPKKGFEKLSQNLT